MSNNLKEKAYSIIKSKIISGYFKPNEYLDEKILCNLTNTSRTPVREAMSKLELEGWINIFPRKGAQIPDITLRQVNDLFQTRENFEPKVLQIGYKNLDKEYLKTLKMEMESIKYIPPKNSIKLEELDGLFHSYLLKSTNNHLIIKIMENILEHIERIRRLAFYCQIRGEEARCEHIEIINYLLENKQDKAKTSLKKHIQNSHLEFLKKVGTLNY